MLRKRKKMITICGAVLLLLGAGVYIITRPGEKLRIPERNPPIIVDRTIRPSLVLPYLQDGDIILRMNDSVWSSVFRDYSPRDRRFSHVGIVRIRDDDLIIIHSVGSFANRERGVELVTLDQFLRIATAIGVYRVISADGSVISDTAMNYLGFPFDFDFDLSDYDTVYCTELLYRALIPLGLEHILATVYVESVNQYVIPLDSISYTPYIEELVYIVRVTRQQTMQEDQLVIHLENPIRTRFFHSLIQFFRRIR